MNSQMNSLVNSSRVLRPDTIFRRQMSKSPSQVIKTPSQVIKTPSQVLLGRSRSPLQLNASHLKQHNMISSQTPTKVVRPPMSYSPMVYSQRQVSPMANNRNEESRQSEVNMLKKMLQEKQ